MTGRRGWGIRHRHNPGRACDGDAEPGDRGVRYGIGLEVMRAIALPGKPGARQHDGDQRSEPERGEVDG